MMLRIVGDHPAQGCPGARELCHAELSGDPVLSRVVVGRQAGACPLRTVSARRSGPRSAPLYWYWCGVTRRPRRIPRKTCWPCRPVSSRACSRVNRAISRSRSCGVSSEAARFDGRRRVVPTAPRMTATSLRVQRPVAPVRWTRSRASSLRAVTPRQMGPGGLSWIPPSSGHGAALRHYSRDGGDGGRARARSASERSERLWPTLSTVVTRPPASGSRDSRGLHVTSRSLHPERRPEGPAPPPGLLGLRTDQDPPESRICTGAGVATLTSSDPRVNLTWRLLSVVALSPLMCVSRTVFTPVAMRNARER